MNSGRSRLRRPSIHRKTGIPLRNHMVSPRGSRRRRRKRLPDFDDDTLSDHRGAFPDVPPASFLTEYPAMPSMGVNLDFLIGDWFDQDGGASVAENALALVFSEQVQTKPLMSGSYGHHNPLQDVYTLEDRPQSSRGLPPRMSVNEVRRSKPQMWSDHSSLPGSHSAPPHPSGAALPRAVYEQSCRIRTQIAGLGR